MPRARPARWSGQSRRPEPAGCSAAFSTSSAQRGERTREGDGARFLRDYLQHIGTYGAANGGELGQIAWKWLEWTTRGDQQPARMFNGASCTLCKDPAWHIMKKKIGGQS